MAATGIYKFWKQLGPKLEIADAWQWAKQLVQDLNSQDARIQQAVVPPGYVLIRRTGPTPAGYLLEDGASYTIAAYPALFAVIGYAYGGAGANFNVPNNGSASIIKY